MPRKRPISRRTFLGGLSTAVPLALGGTAVGRTPATAPASRLPTSRPAREYAADVIVVGGGLGGVAAALAAARLGRDVVLTEPTDWIGGQLTSQAVPPDEHPWIEQFGATRTYRDLRARIREYYRRNYPLTAAAQSAWNLNPGNGGVSLLCHEPRVALAVLTEMLAPYVSAGRVRILLGHRPVSADVAGDRVQAVQVRCDASGAEVTLHAPFFVDATELGDLLPLTGTEYVTGAEARRDTGEPHAASEPRPANMQAFTCCFAIDYLHNQDHTIDRPAQYDFWRAYVPELTPSWPGALLSWSTTHPQTLEPRTFTFDPVGGGGLWHYRRIADRRTFTEGAYLSDISLVNWPQNDYWLGNLCEVSEQQAADHIAQAKQLSLSLLYWMQTEAPHPGGTGAGWRGLRLRNDVVGTDDGFAKHPYVRESRRIRAEFTVLEQHVGTDARVQETGQDRNDVTAVEFDDSVGVGSYRIDLHPTTGGDNYIDISSLPFQIPLGALLPVRVTNLLPACKNIGTTHITNGCYRLHPVEWNIGESVGTLVAYCLAKRAMPRQVRAQPARLHEYQEWLRRAGVEIRWPRLFPR